MTVNFSSNSQYRNFRQESKARAQQLLQAAQEADQIQEQLIAEEKAEKKAEKEQNSVEYKVKEGAKELGTSTLSGMGWNNPIALFFLPATLTAGLQGTSLEGKHIQGVMKEAGVQWKGVNIEATGTKALESMSSEDKAKMAKKIADKNPGISEQELQGRIITQAGMKESQLAQLPIVGAIPKYKFDSVSGKEFSMKDQFKNFNLKGIIKENTTGLWTNSAVQSFAQQGKSADEIIKLCKITDAAEIEKVRGIVNGIHAQNDHTLQAANNGNIMAKASVATKNVSNKVKDIMGNNVALRGVPTAHLLLPMLFGSFQISAAYKMGGAEEAGKQTIRTTATAIANCTFSSITSAVCAKTGAILGASLAKKMNGSTNAVGTATSVGAWVGSAIGSAVGYFAVDKVVNKVCDLFMGETKMKKMEKEAKEQAKMERAQVIDMLGQKSEMLKAQAIEELQAAQEAPKSRFSRIA